MLSDHADRLAKLEELAVKSTALLTHLTRQTTALTIAVALLTRDMERSGGIDRPALADEAVALLRGLGADEPTEEVVRNLFGPIEPTAEPPRPGLRLIEGGKA